MFEMFFSYAVVLRRHQDRPVDASNEHYLKGLAIQGIASATLRSAGHTAFASHINFVARENYVANILRKAHVSAGLRSAHHIIKFAT